MKHPSNMLEHGNPISRNGQGASISRLTNHSIRSKVEAPLKQSFFTDVNVLLVSRFLLYTISATDLVSLVIQMGSATLIKPN